MEPLSGSLLETLPSEVLGEVVGGLSPPSLRALTHTSRRLQERVTELPRVLVVPPDQAVTLGVLESLPNIREVRGPVLLSDNTRDLYVISRRLRGNLDIRISDSAPFFGDRTGWISTPDIIQLLVVRGLLYPGNETSVEWKIPNSRDYFFRYSRGHLFLSISGVATSDLQPERLALLPLFSLGISIRETVSSRLRHLTNNLLESLRDLGVRLIELVVDSTIDTLDYDVVPYLETIRFHLPPVPMNRDLTMNVENLFLDPAPTITRIQGARIYLLAGNPNLWNSRVHLVESQYPNLKSGDMTFVHLIRFPTAMSPSELQDLHNQSLVVLQLFKISHPGMEVRVELRYYNFVLSTTLELEE